MKPKIPVDRSTPVYHIVAGRPIGWCWEYSFDEFEIEQDNHDPYGMWVEQTSLGEFLDQHARHVIWSINAGYEPYPIRKVKEFGRMSFKK